MEENIVCIPLSELDDIRMEIEADAYEVKGFDPSYEVKLIRLTRVMQILDSHIAKAKGESE